MTKEGGAGLVGAIEMMEHRIERGALLVGKWYLDRRLGEGGVGEVWSATHKNGHRVAIKFLKPTWAADEVARGRFLREGYLANRIPHPGVVKVLDDFELADGTVFLVMELLEGETLKERWLRAGGRMDVSEVVGITCRILDVLACAHRAGVVHRDIKPDNVFLPDDGSVRLLDFGVARLGEEGSGLTSTGTMLGTPVFMPPEQALGHRDEVGPSSDLFAVGAMMATLISGAYVRPETRLCDLLIAACTKEATRLADLWPRADPALAAVVDRALAFRAQERWPSACAMADALHALPAAALAGAAAPGPHAPALTPTIPSAPALEHLGTTTPWPAPRRAARFPWVFAAVVVIALMLSGWVAVSMA